ncbi:MAG TPA: peptidoglycan recognition protein [Gaiellaceae bacterium]|nr:peptidoglycan recognition protein [Gaiellaceae bacterium]
MKIFLAVAVAFLAAPAAAFGEVSLTMREVPLHGERMLAAAPPARFDMVGLHWQGAGSVDFRTHAVRGRWSKWQPAAPEAEDVPDGARGPWRLGNPYWVGASDRIAYRLQGRVTRLRAYFIQSSEERIPLRRVSVTGSPPLISRPAWGANEAIRRAAPSYAPSVQFAVVHHTAGSNSYTAAQSAAIVRGIEVYHVKGNGWNDIGYNFLVDKYGQVFEGRYGGVDKNVIGAHAGGFNTGSFGVALIGTYQSVAPTVAEKTALVNLLAWRLDIAHVDPLSTLTYASGGNARFPAGTPVFLRAVSGHRDTGFTTCPGAVLYAQLGALARQAAATGLPKLYAPIVQGRLGSLVRFQARLSTSLPWSVTVSDSAGAVVGSGTGTSSAVDWTWDASTAAQVSYKWTISAGADVRPATGTIGTAPVALAIKSLTATPRTISDGTQISYTLTATATVTATLRDAGGHDVATLFTQQHQPGKQTFKLTATNVPEGHFELVLTAANGKSTATASVPVVIDRTVTKFSVTPAITNRDVTFAFDLARVADVRLDIRRAGKVVAPVYSATLAPGTQSVGWKASGTPDGVYAGALTTSGPVGTATRTVLFRIDTKPPTLRARSFRALRFWVSEPAKVTLIVNGTRVVRLVRAGTFSYRHGSVRTVRILASDAAGNVSRTLRFP